MGARKLLRDRMEQGLQSEPLVTIESRTLGEYWDAVQSTPEEARRSGIGTVAYDWHDKPHRLVYDLLNEIGALKEMLAAAEKDL